MASERTYTTKELKETCLCGHVDRQHVLMEGVCVCAGCDCSRFVGLVSDRVGAFHRALEESLAVRRAGRFYQ